MRPLRKARIKEMSSLCPKILHHLERFVESPVENNQV